MPLQKIIGIVLIVVVTAAAAFFIRSSLTTPDVTEAHNRLNRIRIATSDLPTGTLIQQGDLAWRDVPDTPDEDLFTPQNGGEDKLFGAVVRLPLAKDQPVERSRIVLPDSPGFLAAALAPGKRAVSVAITDVSGNAGLIQPGDRVDMILTQHLAGDGQKEVVGEIVLTNVRVIAVGRQIAQQRDSGKADGKADGNAGASARTVTFEVDGDQPERVAVAAQLGDLSLALRSLAAEVGHMRQMDGSIVSLAPETVAKPRPVRSADVSEALPKSAPPPSATPVPTAVRIYRGDKSN